MIFKSPARELEFARSVISGGFSILPILPLFLFFQYGSGVLININNLMFVKKFIVKLI